MKSFTILRIFNSFFKLLLIAQLLFLFSCDKPNLDGHWHVYYGETRKPTSLLWDIRNDSLLSKDSYSLGPDSFKISRNKIELIWPEERQIYSYVCYGDSCLLYQNDTLQLVLRKKINCKLYEHEVELKINLKLPVASENEVTILNESDSSLSKYAFIYIGQPLDTLKKGYILLNDQLSEISDLSEFLDGYDYQLLLLIDKNIKMKLIDEILLERRYYQCQVVHYIYDIKEDNKKLGFIKKRLYGLENINYYPKISSNRLEEMPPPPPHRINLFKVEHLDAFILALKQNELIFQDRKIGYHEIKDSIQNYFNSQVVKNKAVNIIFEWDNSSIFDSYAKISVILENARKDYREKTATLKYNKTYEELNAEDSEQLKKEFPVNIIEISPSDRYAINKKKKLNTSIKSSRF